MRSGLGLAIAAGVVVFALNAQAAVDSWAIDFENDGSNASIVHGQVIDNEYATEIPGSNGVGVTISATNLISSSDRAVAFDTDAFDSDDPDLWAPFTDINSFAGDVDDDPQPANQYSPGNVLIIQENTTGCSDGVCNDPDDEGGRPAGALDLVFDTAVTIFSIDFFDIEGAEDGQSANNEVRFFDANGNQIGQTFYTPNTGGDRHWDRLVFNGDLGIQNVRKVRVEMAGSGGIDNVVGGVADAVPVPLPPSLLLFGSALALAGAGYVRGHRKKSA